MTNRSLLSTGVFLLLCATTVYAQPQNLSIENVYSRGNDDRPEGNFETAIMGLRASATLEQGAVKVNLAYSTRLSTISMNHAHGSSAYYLREVHRFHKVDDSREWLQKDSHNPAARIEFTDDSIIERLTRHQSVNVLGAQLTAQLPEINLTEEGTHFGRVYIQSRVGQRFADDEQHNSVKHKIEWYVQIKNGELVSFTAALVQPNNNLNHEMLRWMSGTVSTDGDTQMNESCPEQERFRVKPNITRSQLPTTPF